MTKSSLAATLAVAFLLLASQPAAAVKPGFYLGGSVGGASTEAEIGGVEIDDDDFAWKVFGGFHFLQFFAVEAAYRDLGEASGDIAGAGNASFDTTGFDLSGLVGLPLGPIYLYGKLGLFVWEQDFDFNNLSDSDDSTDVLAGAGLSWDFFKVQLRGEIEYMDAGEGAYMYSVGAAWRF